MVGLGSAISNDVSDRRYFCVRNATVGVGDMALNEKRVPPTALLTSDRCNDLGRPGFCRVPGIAPPKWTWAQPGTAHQKSQAPLLASLLQPHFQLLPNV